MSQRSQPFVKGEFYHIYSRGNSKQKIFLDDYDRDRIRKKIDAWEFKRGENMVSIGAWVLMPNHFHLYITISRDVRKQGFRENGITEFMHKLLTSYSKYFNKKYKRTGSLFESKFKAVHIEKDTQAKYLFSYIHLNPVKLVDSKWKEEGIKDWKKVKAFLDNYKWSSYLDYKKVVRPENQILNLKDFPRYFRNIKDFDAEIKEWLSFSNKK